jgi:serine protease inhibitor
MALDDRDVVAPCNGLTSRWVATLREADSVLSGAGAWLALAMVLSGAEGEAQRELESALLVEKGDAAGSARHLLEQVRSHDGMQAAVGLWTRPVVPVRDRFVAAVAPMAVGTLPDDLSVLDRWVADATSGILNRFPRVASPETLMVVASVLAAEADWVAPFSEEAEGWLHRREANLDAAALLRGETLTVSRVVCETVADFDVHLVAGAEGERPGAVLGLGIAALSDGAEVVRGSELRRGDAGGCLRVEEVAASGPDPQLQVSLPRFEISSDHDLLTRHELFGLTAAMDRSHGHFPGISDVELAVEAVAQSALARFSAEGFRAAATTALSALAAGVSVEPHRCHVVRVYFDRPFGFLVVDRGSGLVDFAGWVTGIPERRQPATVEESE